MNWQAIWLSLQLAALTVVVLLVIGIPLSYWFSFSRWRWKFLLEAVIALPLVLPPTVLGYYILVATSPRSWPGAFYQRLFGDALPFSFEGLLLGSAIYNLPFAVQPVASAFSAVDRRLIEASWTLGVSRFGTFRRVILPQATQGILTAAILVFAHAIGEFGVVLMVGGNIPGETQTVSIAIYEDVQALDYQTAGRTSLLLLVFSFTVLAAVYSLNRKVWAVWPPARD